MRIITSAHEKGGVGKSTTAINLGVGLATAGRKTLIVDLDSQGDATKALGLSNENNGQDVSAIFASRCNNLPSPSLEDIVQHHDEGVDIIPGGKSLSEVSLAVQSLFGREKVLANYLDTLQGQYDYIIIDTSPTLDIFTINALAASNSVIIPLEADCLSVKGLGGMLDTIEKMRMYINPGLEIEGLLITKYSAQTRFSRQMSDNLYDNVGREIPVFQNPIRKSVRVVEASALGVSIFEHDPRGNAAKDYFALVQDIIRKERVIETKPPEISR